MRDPHRSLPGTRLRWLLAAVVLIGVPSSFSTVLPITPNPQRAELPTFSRLTTRRTVIGSMADMATHYAHGRPITIIDILEFKTDSPLQQPHFVDVRFCGDGHAVFEPFVHTDVTLVYDLASRTRLTGCLQLISIDPWQDGTTRQAVILNPRKLKRSLQLDESLQGIIHRAVD
jgi:hypothetical protein